MLARCCYLVQCFPKYVPAFTLPGIAAPFCVPHSLVAPPVTSLPPTVLPHVQIISPVDVTGRVVVVPHLSEVQDEVYEDPTVLVVDTVTGG